MKFANVLALALLVGVATSASADYSALRVQVNPTLGTLRYEAPGMASGSLGCGEDPNVCMFRLELDMRLQLGGLGAAQAAVNKLELHGEQGVFAEFPDTIDYLEQNLRSYLTNSAFAVTPGPNVDETTLTASFALSEGLVLRFTRAQLMSMSGGPDYRPVDGPKYTFGYTAPEPSTLMLGLVMLLGGVGMPLICRRKREHRSN